MMNERIKELMITDGIYDCIVDPYDKFNTGDQYGSVEYDLERFAKKIIEECCDISLQSSHRWDDMGAIIALQIKKHFGVQWWR